MVDDVPFTLVYRCVSSSDRTVTVAPLRTVTLALPCTVTVPRLSTDVRLLMPMESVNSTVRRVLEQELVTAPPGPDTVYHYATRPVHTQREDAMFVGKTRQGDA